MPATIPATIPEDKPLSFNENEKKEKGRTVFKLIKVYTDDNADDSIHAYDSSNKTILNKSHTQLFYNITDKQDFSQCKPSYCREVRRPNNNIDNLYWYNEALKSVSSSTSEPVTLWTIDQVKIKKSKVFKKFKRPRTFSINSTELGCNSTFEYGSSENEPKGYSGEISAPFDDTCTQRYRWVRYKDGSRWSFIARNDPNTSLAELRKTDSENAFDIVFMKSPPPGWRVGDTVNRYSTQSTSTEFNARYGRIFSDNDESVEFIGRYPSVFSNPSTYRSSTTSGFLSNRESSFSDISNSPNFDGRISTLSNLKNINNGNGKNDESYDKEKFSLTFTENNFTSPKIDSERYWQEYVLASTVTVQEEVNSNKRRLWKKGN